MMIWQNSKKTKPRVTQASLFCSSKIGWILCIINMHKQMLNRIYFAVNGNAQVFLRINRFYYKPLTQVMPLSGVQSKFFNVSQIFFIKSYKSETLKNSTVRDSIHISCYIRYLLQHQKCNNKQNRPQNRSVSFSKNLINKNQK